MPHTQITLANTSKEELNLFFEFQLNQEANFLAAFTAKDPSDKATYIKKYSAHLDDPTITMCTIWVGTWLTF